MLRIGIIGCGNISNSRHIPALKKSKNAEIVGFISDSNEKIQRTFGRYPEYKNRYFLLIDNTETIENQLSRCDWFIHDVDAVIVGVPPKQHFSMVEACLRLKKHVLVEKPMMMSVKECDKVIALSEQNELVLAVMHSFQFSNGIQKLSRLVEKQELGTVKSILELQLSNRSRRLPVWYDDLPLGLYFDEAAHFFYCAHKFGGVLQIKNAKAVCNPSDNTPRFIQAQMQAGDVPVQMYMNFNSPICEWGILLIGEKKIAIYDFFKDILIVLDNDRQHLAKDVLKTSWDFTCQFWRGFIINGFRMVTGKLLYGHDTCINEFISAIQEKKTICEELSPYLGREVIKAMNEVVAYATEE